MSPDRLDAILRLAEAAEPAMVEDARRLVRLDTQTPPSATGAAADDAASRLSGLPGVAVRRYESEPPVVNLVARLEGGRPGRRLILSGHLDTYPIGDRNAWTVDPLGGDLIDGRLFGRGSADMKGGVAVLIEVFRLLALHARPFDGEIVLALAGDEERMGELGTQWLLDHVPETRGDAALVADVGGPRALRLGEKGMVWLELTSTGRQAHAAHVHAGRNALDALLAALNELRGVEALPAAPPEEAVATIAAAAGREGADGAEARSVMQRPTLNLGVLKGGLISNLVPAEAEAGLDIRIPLGVTCAEVEGFVAEVLARHPAVEARATRRYEATWTPPTSPIATAALAAAEKALGGPVWFDMRIGGSDARLFRRVGIPTVVLGFTPHNLGAADEHLLAEEFVPLLKSYLGAAARFLRA